MHELIVQLSHVSALVSFCWFLTCTQGGRTCLHQMICLFSGGITLPLDWQFYASKQERSGEAWEPPSSFKRKTVKYWVAADDIVRVKLFIIKHLPILELSHSSRIHLDFDEQVLFSHFYFYTSWKPVTPPCNCKQIKRHVAVFMPCFLGFDCFRKLAKITTTCLPCILTTKRLIATTLVFSAKKALK